MNVGSTMSNHKYRSAITFCIIQTHTSKISKYHTFVKVGLIMLLFLWLSIRVIY